MREPERSSVQSELVTDAHGVEDITGGEVADPQSSNAVTVRTTLSTPEGKVLGVCDVRVQPAFDPKLWIDDAAALPGRTDQRFGNRSGRRGQRRSLNAF